MKLLIIYETVEGQTGKIVDFAADRLRSAGHDVHLFDTAGKYDGPSFADMDTVLLAAPVHERRHPSNFESVISTRRAELEAHRTLMISVSLKAAFPEGMEEAQDYLTEMQMRTKFVSDAFVLAAGAVRTSSYGYFERQVLQNVLLGDRQVDLLDGVREFTDWDSLGAAIDSFVK